LSQICFISFIQLNNLQIILSLVFSAILEDEKKRKLKKKEKAFSNNKKQ